MAGTLTVTPVGLTITADNKSKAYGAALPTLTAGYSGFVNGDTAASLTTAADADARPPRRPATSAATRSRPAARWTPTTRSATLAGTLTVRGA